MKKNPKRKPAEPIVAIIQLNNKTNNYLTNFFDAAFYLLDMDLAYRLLNNHSASSNTTQNSDILSTDDSESVPRGYNFAPPMDSSMISKISTKKCYDGSLVQVFQQCPPYGDNWKQKVCMSKITFK